ncbi:LysR family transcriptional regulator [Roseomonas sp. NAR14]|uniref:LysR family transcriptional regulator n=1 Tax=Roseomonas acroporae TaxID=2937791 RepID=A0A9X1YDH3_9PROT|nr:LysR family transcriptional regulator [Roseomonas acroporae]MCK8787043.1 LysR family transcriptional regulator [Roseomonas acroporae]
MDQLAAMRAFARIVETGSFTRAAASLNQPKATVTKLIQGLEAHLRTGLLSRTTRRLVVTADGAAYYERAVRLLAELDELDGSMALSRLSPKGRLRIDVLAVLARDVIIPALPGFFALYPDIRLEIGASDRSADLLAENVDCVIRGGTIRNPNLVARRIATIGMVTCAAPAYLERRGMPAHPAELRDRHDAIGHFSATTGETYPLGFDRDGEHVEVAGGARVAVNEVSSSVLAVVAGLGVGQLPRFAAASHLAAGRLVPVLPDWSVAPVPLHIVYPPGRQLSNKVRVFADWAISLFQDVRF